MANRMVKSALVCLFVVALTACDWPMFAGGPALTGFSPGETKIGLGNVSDLAPAWTAPFASENNLQGMSNPVVVNGVAYVGETDGNLYAFDAAGHTNCGGAPTTCQPLWTAPTGCGARRL